MYIYVYVCHEKQIKKMIQRIHFIIIIIIITLTLLSAGLTTAQEVEEEREFSYKETNRSNGPSRWGEIREEWRECSSGRMQSPIDMLNERVVTSANLNELQITYRLSKGKALLINRGHDMMVRWNGPSGSHIQINGTVYELKQVHWHTPSEHTIDGRSFDMEAHLVHQSKDNRIAVVGFLYTLGRLDYFLNKIKDDLEAVARSHDVQRNIGFIDPDIIISGIGSKNYYRYTGSLTTPPCTQNVTWTIFQKINTVTIQQLQLLRRAVDDNSEANARPVQPLNDRTVELYRQRSRPK